jgi:hypothetical protein
MNTNEILAVIFYVLGAINLLMAFDAFLIKKESRRLFKELKKYCRNCW